MHLDVERTVGDLHVVLIVVGLEANLLGRDGRGVRSRSELVIAAAGDLGVEDGIGRDDIVCPVVADKPLDLIGVGGLLAAELALGIVDDDARRGGLVDGRGLLQLEFVVAGVACNAERHAVGTGVGGRDGACLAVAVSALLGVGELHLVRIFHKFACGCVDNLVGSREWGSVVGLGAHGECALVCGLIDGERTVLDFDVRLVVGVHVLGECGVLHRDGILIRARGEVGVCLVVAERGLGVLDEHGGFRLPRGNARGGVTIGGFMADGAGGIVCAQGDLRLLDGNRRLFGSGEPVVARVEDVFVGGAVDGGVGALAEQPDCIGAGACVLGELLGGHARAVTVNLVALNVVTQAQDVLGSVAPLEGNAQLLLVEAVGEVVRFAIRDGCLGSIVDVDLCAEAGLHDVEGILALSTADHGVFGIGLLLSDSEPDGRTTGVQNRGVDSRLIGSG